MRKILKGFESGFTKTMDWLGNTKLGKTLEILLLPVFMFMIIIPLYMVLTGVATAVILAPIKFVVRLFN